MTKTKIIIFLNCIYGGGAERTVINIINYMDKAKFDPILVVGSDFNITYTELISKEIRIIKLSKSRARKCILPLRKILLNEKPDVVFSTLTYSNIILLIANILTFARIPAIVREANNLSSQGEIIGLKKIIMRLLYNSFATKIVSLSFGVKTDLIKNYKIHNDKISVIYNPIDIDSINALRKEKVEVFKKDSAEKTLISVGRLEPQKDFYTLLDAFKIITNSVNARLIILGQGSLAKDLKAYCIESKIDDKVFFGGFQSNPYKYFNISDIFILTSKHEGFGHVIVEAMAIGLPVVVTKCPSGPYEIIENNRYGRLVNVGDHQQIAEEVIKLIKNKGLMEKYKRRGLERAGFFEAKGIVKKYEQLFLEVVCHKECREKTSNKLIG